MSLTRPTSPSGGFAFGRGEINKVLRKKCHVYYSLGAFATADIPANKAAVLALYSGGTPKFNPLGHMDENIGECTWKQNSEKLDFYDVPTDLSVTCTLNGARCYPDFLTWLDSSDAKDELSLLFVPDGDDGATFLALSGVTMVHEGNVPLAGKISKIKMTFSRTGNNLTDILKYAILAS